MGETNNSLASLLIAKKWLEDCANNHVLCGNYLKAEPARSTPTRLIFLGDSDQVIHPRLVLSAEINCSIQYCTLSHCWGSDPSRILRLTRDNIETMKKEMPISKLSRTFREAMEFGKRLGFSYIWIDSLCIVQDDHRDWRAEAARMGDVYANSGVTIAATKSPDGDGGCWSSRQVFEVSSCHVDLSWQRGESSEMRRYFCNPSSSGFVSVMRSPLVSRGWVTQEIILSRRVIHFAADQLYWECQRLRANEAFPTGIVQESVKKGVFFAEEDRTRPRVLEVSKYQAWNDAVAIFSRALLTYPRKDKLIAMHSIAARLELNDHLVAGLWRKCLPNQLLWANSDPKLVSHVDPGEYQAPSWSWASLNTAVEPFPDPVDTGSKRSLISIDDVSVTHEDNDPNAPLIAGYLDVTAPIVRMTPPREVGSQTLEEFSISLPYKYIYEFRPDRRCRLSHLYLLWIRQEGGRTPTSTRPRSIFPVHGIVILPVERSSGQYQRVGTFYLTCRSSDSPFEAEMAQALFKDAETEDIPHRGFDRNHVDGFPRYSVRLI